MSKTITIEYNGHQEPISFSNEHDKFLETIKLKFYLDDVSNNQLLLSYFDEDGDINFVDDDTEFENDEVPENWKIEKKGTSQNGVGLDINAKNKIKLKYKENKEKILKKSVALLKKKEEEKDKKHLNEINQIKNDFEGAIKEINQKNEQFIKNLYNIFEQKLKNCMENYNDKIKNIMDKDLCNSQIQQGTPNPNIDSSGIFENNLKEIKDLVDGFLNDNNPGLFDNKTEYENILSLIQSQKNVNIMNKNAAFCEIKIKTSSDNYSLDEINKEFSVNFDIKNTSDINLPYDCYFQGFLNNELVNTSNINLDFSSIKPKENKNNFKGVIKEQTFRSTGKYNIKFIIISKSMGVISNIADYSFNINDDD